MAKEGSAESFAKAARSPLAVLGMTLGVLQAVLVVVAAATNAFPIWMPFGLMGLIVSIVAVTMWFRPNAFYHPNDLSTVTVSISFGDGIVPPELFEERCTVRVLRSSNRTAKSHRAPIAWGNGGWYLKLNSSIVQPFDNVVVELVEKAGPRWRSRPFDPYGTTQSVRIEPSTPGGGT